MEITPSPPGLPGYPGLGLIAPGVDFNPKPKRILEMNQLNQLLILASRERENAFIEYWREQTPQALRKLTEADTVLEEIRARILAAKTETQTKGDLK